MIKEQIKYFAKLKPWPNVRNIVAEIFVIFNVCSNVSLSPTSGNIGFYCRNKVASRRAKIFPTKFINI